MKTFLTTLAVLALSLTVVSAQDVTGFKAPNQSSKQINPPNPHPNLQPKTGGVFVDGVKNGPVMISPTAPASYGIGEKYLSAPSQGKPDLQHECGPAARRDTGGFKLFSLEF